MTGACFVDTNVFVYALDNADVAKRERAFTVLDERADQMLTVSTQVFIELTSVLTRKLSTSLPPDAAQQGIELLRKFSVHIVDVRTIAAAIGTMRDHQLSWWDALIVQSALESRCTLLLSEDFQEGRRFGPLVVENPFRGL